MGGFANKKESRTYDSVYDLRSENTTENTLNIMFCGENVSVPLYICMLSSVEIQHRSYFQNNMTMFGFCTVLYYPVYDRVCRYVNFK